MTSKPGLPGSVKIVGAVDEPMEQVVRQNLEKSAVRMFPVGGRTGNTTNRVGSHVLI